MTDPTPKYFDDNGTEINPDVIPFPKPGLCITCKKDGQAREEEILCNLTRIDQQGEGEYWHRLCEEAFHIIIKRFFRFSEIVLQDSDEPFS